MAPLLLVAAPHVLPIKERLTSDEWQPGSLKARLTFRCIARELIRTKTGFSANKHFSKVLKKVACLPPHPVLPSGLQISLQDIDMEDLPRKILNKGGKKKKRKYRTKSTYLMDVNYIKRLSFRGTVRENIAMPCLMNTWVSVLWDRRNQNCEFGTSHREFVPLPTCATEQRTLSKVMMISLFTSWLSSSLF